MVKTGKKLILGLGFMALVVSAPTHADDGQKVNAFKPEPDDIRASANSAQLRLATGIFDPLNESLDFSATFINEHSSEQYGIVQFQAGKASAAALQNLGLTVLQYMPNDAYVVRWDNAKRAQLNGLGDVRWHGPYQAGFKVSPTLWSGSSLARSEHLLSVIPFADYPVKHLNALILKRVPQAQLVTTNLPKGAQETVIRIPHSTFNDAINALAAEEGIQWINRYYPQRFFNTEAVSAVQDVSSSGGGPGDDNYVPTVTPIWDRNLTGSGQIVGVADSGLDHNEDWFAHLDKGSGIVTALTVASDVLPPVAGPVFNNVKVFGHWIMPGAAEYDHTSAGFHGTHVTGSVAGDRQESIGAGPSGSVSSPTSSGYDNDDGMAPNAQILFQDIGSDSGLTGQGSSPMWEQAHNVGVRIHSNSYGSDTFGEYVGSDQRLDETLRQLEDMVILFAAGNDDGPVNTIGSPGNSKNTVTVGALAHGNSASVAGFSNRGPTDDGRLKPDVSATGSGIESAGGNTDDANVLDTTPQRRTISGTSMSTPITAGSTALLRQYFTDGFYPTGSAAPINSYTPSGSLMKAVLLNGTATDGGFFSNNIGWGRVWLENSLYFPGDARKLRFWDVANINGLTTGQTLQFEVPVLAGEEFRATLVWYDMAGPTGSGVTLVNNLDLRVQQGANTYLGNNFSANVSVTGGSADAINTVEQVRFTAPVTGDYTITVDADSIPGNGESGSQKQGFALVVSGDLRTSSPPPVVGNPIGLNATANGMSGIDLAWSAASNADYYEVYRTDGLCNSADLSSLRYVGNSLSNSYNDDGSIGGYPYSYRVRAFNSDSISTWSNCADVVSDDLCDLPPDFSGNLQVGSGDVSFCRIQLNWDAGQSNCPLGDALRYNVHRGSTPNFVPSVGNLVASTSSPAYHDTSLSDGTPQYYKVIAEDSTLNGSGPNGGNESLNQLSAGYSAYSSQTTEGSVTDNVDNLVLMSLNHPWQVTSQQASDGALSYHSAEDGSDYPSNTCGRIFSQTFSIPVSPGGTPELNYQARYDIEADWDGVVVEISTDGGNNWSDLPPNGGYPSDFNQTGNPPINVCGYAASHGAFNGSTGGSFQSITHNLSAFQGQTVQIRWSLSTDPGSEEEGFYLDQVQYSNVNVPQACAVVTDVIYDNSFE